MLTNALSYIGIVGTVAIGMISVLLDCCPGRHSNFPDRPLLHPGGNLFLIGLDYAVKSYQSLRKVHENVTFLIQDGRLLRALDKFHLSVMMSNK